MAETIRLAVSIDEATRDRLRQIAGANPAGVAVVVGRIIESALNEKKRLVAGIARRLELSLQGKLAETERAGVVQAIVAPKLGMDVGDLGVALDHTAAGMAGLIVKVVLDDPAWTMALFTGSMSNK